MPRKPKETVVYVPIIRRPTRPAFRLWKFYTLGDGARVYVKTREWASALGYIYYLTIIAPGRVLRRVMVISENEFSWLMSYQLETVKAAA